MIKISKEEFKKVCIRFQNGEKSKDLAKEYGINRRSLDERLRNHGIPNNKDKRSRLDETVRQNLIARYRNGESRASIASSLNCSRNTIDRLFAEYDVEDRSHDFTLNHNSFSILTEESKYWIGFLLADGTVYYRKQYKTPTIQLALKASDSNHILKFKQFVTSSNVILCRPTNKFNKHRCEITISSQQIANDLAKYNVSPRKTFTAEAPESLLNDRHFWRGLIDGDGFVSLKKCRKNTYPQMGLCGTPKLMEQFLTYVKVIHDTGANVIHEKTISRVFLYGNCAKAVMKELYTNQIIALDRKSQMAASILQ